MGKGNDAVNLTKVHTWGSVLVDTGSGQDSTSINDAFVYAHMTIEDHEWYQGDRDHVWVYNSNIGTTTVKGNLKIDLNGGNDQVYLYNTVTSYLNVKTYGGEDYISVSSCKVWTHLGELNGGSGHDTMLLRNNAGIGYNLVSSIERFS